MARKHHAAWRSLPVDRAVAAHLGPDAAFVPAGDEVLAVQVTRAPTEPRSPLSELVRAVWALDPGRAHARLRQRLRVTSPPAPFDLDLVPVAARRWALVDPAPGPTPPIRLLAPPPDPAGLPVPEGARPLGDWVGWVLAARGPAADPAARATADRPVAAVLVAADGRALGAAHNRGSTDRSAHAEWLLLRRQWPVAPGSTLVTTLQCCRLCAAAWAACAPADVGVVYVEPDPGRFAQGTRLAGRERRWG